MKREEHRKKSAPNRSALRFFCVFALALVLAGCGSTPARRGGYYLDDGPGDNPPSNLDSIPDARPRVEALNKYANRPYTVLGKTFVPETRPGAYKARGIATWYGRKFQGQRTASGEPYDMYAMTAAHPILPIPSYARVTSLRNNKSVVVRINDRGPFYSGRIIDLSYAAAHKLGIATQGSGMVEVESVLPGSETLVAQASKPAAPDPPPPSPPPATAQIVPATADAGGIYLQLGAFASRFNAEQFMVRLRSQLAGFSESLSIFAKGGLFRVHAGPYTSRSDAQNAADKLGATLGFKPLLLIR